MNVLLLLLLALQSPQIPKNNPNGTWEAETGSKFQLRLAGSDLKVEFVPGSNARFSTYLVDLKNQEEVNTYTGKGTFVAKMNTGKDCSFETDWTLVVVAPNRIIGTTSNIIADPNTCAILETRTMRIDLKKVQ